MRRTAALDRRLFRLLASIGLVAVFAGSAAASQIGFVYAVLQVSGGTNQIYGFRFDPSTGALTLLPSFPVASGGTGTAASGSEQLAYFDGRLYVLNDGDNTMTVFSVNRSTGALTAMPFSPVALGSGDWRCVAVHPSGSPVVVGNGLGGISSVVVTDTTATTGSPFATGDARPFSCRFSQDGTYVYTGGNGGSSMDRIAGFSVNASTGVLTALAGSPFDSGAAFPRGYATDSSGRLFTMTIMPGTSNVRAFTTASGVPTGVSGSPFASGLSFGIHGVLHPGGFYLVADFGNRVGSYQIGGTGAATTVTAVSGSPFAAGGTNTSALALTPDGAHLVAANATSRNLTVFQVTTSTGALTSLGVQAANTLGASGNVTGLAFAPGEAGFVYAIQQVDSGANQIHGFRINPSTGALTPLSGFPTASGGTGSSNATSEHTASLNGRLYVVNDGSDTLSAFKVNRTTGALTALGFSPLALGNGEWACVAVHPSGSPVVVGNVINGLVSFNVSAIAATAAAGSPFATGFAPSISCAFSRDGSHLYTHGTENRFAGFSVNAGTGVLTPLGGSPFDSGNGNPVGYSTDSSGRLFLVNVAGDNQVRAFTTSAGVPTGVSSIASGLTEGIHGVRHPSGFYMVADRIVGRVGVYQIGGSGAATTLAAVSGSPFASLGTFTHALALTEDGSFLVAANAVSRNLTVFQVNPATGGLTSRGVQAADTLGATGRVTGVTFAQIVPPFIDDPLTAVTPVIKAVHITELRTRIDVVRAQYGLGPYAYTDPTLTIATTVVRAVHVSDLRAALADVYTATATEQPSYADPMLTTGTTVKFAHISELRAAVVAIE